MPAEWAHPKQGAIAAAVATSDKITNFAREPAWHRAQRRQRSNDRVLTALDRATKRLKNHHSSANDMSNWENYISKKEQRDLQKYVICNTPGCDGWTWMSRSIGKCNKCWSPFDWNNWGPPMPPKDPVPYRDWSQPKGDDPWAAAAGKGVAKRWGNYDKGENKGGYDKGGKGSYDKGGYDKGSHDSDDKGWLGDFKQKFQSQQEDDLSAIKEEWLSFQHLFSEVDEEHLPDGLAGVVKNLRDKIAPEPPPVPPESPESLFKKAKYDAQTARQEYLKIQLRAQGHRKKCAEYKQWLDCEQAKLDEAIQQLEPARAWDEEARQILEDIIKQQEQEQLAKDIIELDKGGPIIEMDLDDDGPQRPKRIRLAEDAASIDEVLNGGESSDDVECPQEFMLLQAQFRVQQRLQQQVLQYQQIKKEHREARARVHSFRTTNPRRAREGAAPFPVVGEPPASDALGAAIDIEKRRLEMEEQVKGAISSSTTPEAAFPDGLLPPRGTPEVPAGEAGARWMSTK